MFNKLSAYNNWLNQNKELLIEAWELGITWRGDPIDQTTYEDFVAHMWSLECENQK